MKLKRGMLFQSNKSKTQIRLISKKSGNGHWNTRKLSTGKSHMIHEGTLLKHYNLIKEPKDIGF